MSILVKKRLKINVYSASESIVWELLSFATLPLDEVFLLKISIFDSRIKRIGALQISFLPIGITLRI